MIRDLEISLSALSVTPNPSRENKCISPKEASRYVFLKRYILLKCVQIVMLEKLDCILSKSATRPYIYEYKCECLRTHLCIDPSGRQQSPVIRDSPPAIRDSPPAIRESSPAIRWQRPIMQ